MCDPTLLFAISFTYIWRIPVREDSYQKPAKLLVLQSRVSSHSIQTVMKTSRWRRTKDEYPLQTLSEKSGITRSPRPMAYEPDSAPYADHHDSGSSTPNAYSRLLRTTSKPQSTHPVGRLLILVRYRDRIICEKTNLQLKLLNLLLLLQ